MLKNLGTIAATAIVLLILLATSVPLMHWFVRDGREAEFAANTALWSDHGIEDYRYSVRVDCECPPPAGTAIDVVVRDGRAVSVEVSAGGSGDRATGFDAVPETIDAMFATVREGIDADPDTIIVEYDTDYGFPSLLRIDHRRDYSDDDVTIEITGFRILRP